MPFLKEGLLRR